MSAPHSCYEELAAQRRDSGPAPDHNIATLALAR